MQSFLVYLEAQYQFLILSNSVSNFFFSIIDFSFRSTKLENTSRDLYPLADQDFVIYEKQTL